MTVVECVTMMVVTSPESVEPQGMLNTQRPQSNTSTPSASGGSTGDI
jgi:hypothetical protein